MREATWRMTVEHIPSTTAPDASVLKITDLAPR